MNQLAIKATICVAICFGAFLWGYNAGSLSGAAEVSTLKEKAAQERAAAAVMLSQEVLTNELNKAKLAKQTQDNLALVDRNPASVRVQLPSTLCADYSQADASGSGQEGIKASGALLESVGGILSADRSRAIEIVREAEIELIYCREVKEWVAGLK